MPSFACRIRRAVVVVAGVGGDPVVGADRAERRALGRFVGLVAVGHRDRVFHSFPTRRSSDLVELPGDRAAGGRAEQAGDRGLVLEHAADEARGGGLRGFDRRTRRGHFHGLRFAAGFRRAVVVVAGGGGDPVVAAERAARRALGRFVGLVAVGHRYRVFGRRRALPFFLIRGPSGLRAAGGRAEQAGDRGLVLEHAADEARGGGLRGFDRRTRRGHFHGLRFAAGFRRAVVVVEIGRASCRESVERAERGALGRFVGRVAVGHRDRVFGRRRALAFFVFVELPGDRASAGRAQQARASRVGLADVCAADRGGGLRGFDRRTRRGHFHGLRFAAGFRRAVVVVAGVGGDPVVGADREIGRASCREGGCVAVGHGDRDVDRRRALAFFVFVELPGDRAAGVRVERAGDRGLALRHWGADVCCCGLRGFDRRTRRGHFHGLRFAAGFRRAVVVVAGVGGDPVVGADR